ncbi:Decaprenyl diphosphate synthase-like protein [Linnemannia elongata]|nr:Decaprenyl diphosphate synthase-like protein [Linnemannia elongata]KAK5821703.1 Decaprenyl diphosphate synthase-like protein [Linnemannia elongata]
MPSPSPVTTLRRRGGSPSRDTPTNDLTSKKEQQPPLKTLRTAADLMADHPAIKPVIPASQETPFSSSTQATGETSGTSFTRTTTTTTTASSPSIASRILHILLKPFYFLLFALLHLGHELVISTRTMKTLLQVFFLPHLFPVAPELVRIVRKDLGEDLVKKPKHLAVITEKSGITLTGEVDETEEDEWHAKVAQLAQWSSAVGIKTLSIMRNAPLHPEDLEALQDRIDHTMKDFYKEEKRIPIALVRTLRPVEESLSLVFQQSNGNNDNQPTILRDLRLHGGRAFDLDIVILSPEDGHDRLAGNVRLLGKAALHQQVSSDQITTKFLDTQLSADLSEPELLIILKDDLDLSSYPPWHIRLTEIYHHPDQAVIPVYTMFLQALHRYAKCEQRFGK